MKAILQTLFIAAVILIQATTANGQYTYQTALRVLSGFAVANDSNTVLQAGVGTGCATVTTQPVWGVMGFCDSNNLTLNITTSGPIGGPFAGSGNISIIIYGPFTDTLNMSSKLINSNIDTCINGLVLTQFSSWTIYSFPNNRGDIYMVLLMTSTNVAEVFFYNASSSIDTTFCPFCNSELSALYQRICTVTYDSASQKNKIVWTKDIFTPAQDYVIFRKNIAGTYDTLAFQSVSQLSEYVDATSSPMAKLYEYKLGIRDSCGQFVDKNNNLNSSFTTMHLITYPAGNNTSSLLWNKGSFQGPFYIYRTDPSGVTSLIDSIVATTDPQTYTDINAPAGLCSYQIGVNINPPCVASVMPSYNIVKSNPGYVTVTGINELTDLSKAITVEPNPFNQYTNVDLHLLSKQNIKVVLINLTGQVVMQHENVKTDELIIERNNLSQGLYFLEVTGDGFYARKKLVVE